MRIPALHAVSWTHLLSAAEALIIGAMIGLERRGAGKSVGVRTFGLVALAFTMAWWQSPQVTYGLLLLCILFVTALNIRSFMAERWNSPRRLPCWRRRSWASLSRESTSSSRRAAGRS